jgi:sodium-dependent dicarboxylate transporter 2/3/5
MSTPEWRMAVIFVTTALLWAFREPVDGWGWAPWLESYGLLSAAPGEGFYVDDSTVAIAMALVSFVVPAAGLGGAPLLDWEA